MRGISLAGFASAGLALAPVLAQQFFPIGNGNPIGMAAANAISNCSTNDPTGWAALASQAVSYVPLIGAELATGGFLAMGVAATLALGGMWLAKYVEKHAKEGDFPWGKVIRWASLATSILISLPAILPAIGMGLNFISQAMNFPGGDPGLNHVADVIGKLGEKGAFSGTAMAGNGVLLGLMHMLTCALPLGLTGFLFTPTSRHRKDPVTQPNVKLAEMGDYIGRVQERMQGRYAAA